MLTFSSTKQKVAIDKTYVLQLINIGDPFNGMADYKYKDNGQTDFGKNNVFPASLSIFKSIGLN